MVLVIPHPKILPRFTQLPPHLPRFPLTHQSLRLLQNTLAQLHREPAPNRRLSERAADPPHLLGGHSGRGQDRADVRVNEVECEDGEMPGAGGVGELEGREAVLVDIGEGEGVPVAEDDGAELLVARVVVVESPCAQCSAGVAGGEVARVGDGHSEMDGWRCDVFLCVVSAPNGEVVETEACQFGSENGVRGGDVLRRGCTSRSRRSARSACPRRAMVCPRTVAHRIPEEE